ncbi:efflux RND transporter permease subunit [Algoriphagus yeomjeoni]|uniref:efflux RND transporter permease subunit n=1 Tax=Algoriphagus yeomjeoni TaxID=291403 RepID=UPI003CE54D2B
MILTATFSIVIGMMPIEMAGRTASGWKNELDLVIIVGLLSSRILTVYQAPVIYYSFENLKM